MSLEDVLDRARDLGFLGPGPVGPHIEHAERLLPWLTDELEHQQSGDVLDLGSGGGLPGLVLAMGAPASRWCLLDANLRRTEFLSWAVGQLGLRDRVRVIRARAEVVATDPALREHFAVVTSRSFGPAPVTAECAVVFLAPGGALAVSEPPDHDPNRWPEDGVAALGLRLETQDSWAILRRHGSLPEHLPRREGAAAKRPAW